MIRLIRSLTIEFSAVVFYIFYKVLKNLQNELRKKNGYLNIVAVINLKKKSSTSSFLINILKSNIRNLR